MTSNPGNTQWPQPNSFPPPPSLSNFNKTSPVPPKVQVPQSESWQGALSCQIQTKWSGQQTPIYSTGKLSTYHSDSFKNTDWSSDTPDLPAPRWNSNSSWTCP